jgi:non-homologous end joining protein Ku
MRRKEMMGIGYVTLSSRKRPIALEPLENGIHGITLRHIEVCAAPRNTSSISGAAIAA